MKLLKPSLRKLNAKGISHVIAPIAVVLVVGIAGSYMLVSSHADSITPAKAVVSGSKAKKEKVVITAGLYKQGTANYPYSIILKLSKKDKKPMTPAQCAGTLILTAKISPEVIEFSPGKGLFPTWDGTACKYVAIMSQDNITKATNTKGKLKIKLNIDYRGTADFHSYKKSLTLKSIIQ